MFNNIFYQLLLLQLAGGFSYLMALRRVRTFSRSGSNPFIRASALSPTCHLNPCQCTILMLSITMQQLQHLLSAASMESCLDHHDHALTSSQTSLAQKHLTSLYIADTFCGHPSILTHFADGHAGTKWSRKRQNIPPNERDATT